MLGKRRRPRKKLESPLAKLPIQSINWRDFQVELLFLGDLAIRMDGVVALKVFAELREHVSN